VKFILFVHTIDTQRDVTCKNTPKIFIYL